MALVYMATNIVNGKRYIGMTRRTLGYRRSAHIGRAERGEENACPRITAAIRKYGRDAFEWCVLQDGLSVSDAKAKEVELIALLKPEYNVTVGGDGGGTIAWNKRSVICLDDGNVFPSMDAAGKFYGASSGSEVSLACQNGKTVVHGRHFEIYTVPLTDAERHAKIDARKKKKISERKKTNREPLGRLSVRTRDKLGRRMTGPRSVSRQVKCLDDGELYESASAAAAAYGVAKSGLIELCLGKRNRKTIGGLRFIYVGGDCGPR